MLVGQLYRQVRNRFRQAGLSTPELDAKLLVSAALEMSVSDLVLNETDEVGFHGVELANGHAEKRLGGMPVGRILGEREFYGRSFRLHAATLEPRPDTEVLIDAVLHRSDPESPSLMCDIGTGTGAIAVTLLAELPRSSMIALDLSEDALACASANASSHGVGERFFPLCADYLSALGQAESSSAGPGLDWIISNPPYIRTAILQELSREVIQHDPNLALDGGETGLEAYVRIVTDAVHLLRPGGQIAFEIGYDQAGDVKKQLRHHGFGAIEIINDLAGNDRVVVARKM
ncbi:peptide chain release factor N(5)-glutamine methyltransferase [Roseibium sp. SCPC15]|uniref:peptide chain release factor N(5)-glutamine methyltransferase n=1 Tax=Roseibium sp. SCP15 TaxID=3141376 RepID=UPI00333D93E9